MLKLAGFNSTIYSFNKKTGVSFTPSLLSKSLNASDLDTNAWPPECVVHDIDPLQLLETDCSLPMVSVEGNCIGDVEIYSSQLLHLNFHWLLKLFLANKSVSEGSNIPSLVSSH